MEIHKGIEIFVKMTGEAGIARIIADASRCDICPCHEYCDATSEVTTCDELITEYFKSDKPYDLKDKYLRKNK